MLKYPQLTVSISWFSGWVLIVPVPRIKFETLIDRFDHFKYENRAYISHIDWLIVTAKEVRVKSEKMGY